MTRTPKSSKAVWPLPVLEPVMAGVDAAAELLSALHVAAYAPQREAGWDSAAMTALLASPGMEAHTIILEGKPAGFTMIRRILDEAEIVTIGVIPALGGQGIGRRALEMRLKSLAMCGVRTVFLEVRKDNERAIRLYRGLGFADIGARKDYYTTLDNHKVDALCMRRDLVPC